MTISTAKNDLDGDLSTVIFLSELLDSPYDVLRCDAVQALGFLPGEKSLGAIIKALRDEDEDVRCDAVAALGLVADQRAIPALVENLKLDPCGDVKVLAVELLGQLAAKEAAPLLRDLVAGRDVSPEIQWDDDGFFEDGWDDWLDIQFKSITALGQLEDQTSAQVIVAALGDEQGQDLSEVGCKALACMGEKGLSALEGMLDDASERMKRAIVGALSGASAKTAIPYLHDLLKSPDPQLRLAALQNLSTHKNHIPCLKLLLDDPDPVVRTNAFRLAQPTEQQIVDVLFSDAPGPVMIAALERLNSGKKLGADHPYIKLLIHLADHPSQDVAAAAITALTSRGGNKIMAELETRMQDPETPDAVAWAIVRALGTLSSKRGIDILAEAAFSDVREIRMEALSSLQRRALTGSKNAKDVLCQITTNQTVDIKSPEGPRAKDNNAAVRREMTQSGLNIEEPDADQPSSTLGAIFGDEQTANGWLAANENSEILEPLNDHEMALLAMAERMPKKQKISLEQSSQSAAEDSRRVAVRLLVPCAGSDVNDILVSALDVKDEDLCRSAADGLIQRFDKDHPFQEQELEKISHLLFSANGDLRRLGLELLALQGADAVRPYLQKSLNDTDVLVRSTAIRLSPRDLLSDDQLSRLLDDPMPLVRSAAASVIASSRAKDRFTVLFGFVFKHGGFHCLEMAKKLSTLSSTRAVAKASSVLAAEDRKSDWAIAMEFLKFSLRHRAMN